MNKKTEHTVDERLFQNHDKFQSLDVEQDWQQVRERMGFESERKINWIWTAAAIMIILLGIGFLTRDLLFTPRIMLTESAGEAKSEVRLADGSTVMLNTNSELSYPSRFGRKSREVTLNGEGFFEVTGDPEKPFIINISDRATVEVLGTSFNISAYNHNDSISVHVVEGTVAFSAAGSSSELTILGKNEHAMLKVGRISRGETINQNFLSWKTGILTFEQERMDNVLRELGTYYNREFILEGEESEEVLFTTTIDNQELESVLEELNLVLGLQYSLEEEQVFLFWPDQKQNERDTVKIQPQL